MKIVIPSIDRANTIITHKFFERARLDYTVVVHDDEQKNQYLMNPTINSNKLIVSNAPRGISYIRQWIVDNLIEKDEWYLSLDDNVKGFTGVDPLHYNLDEIPVVKDRGKKPWSVVYEYEFDAFEFLEKCKEMIEIGEKIRAYNLGFATTDNYFFRGKHYRTCAMIVSKVVLRKNVGIRFDHNFNAIDDYAYTAECLLQHGKVLRNDFIFPVAGHYEKGGIGTYDERLQKKLIEAELLMEKYPGLFKYNNKRKGVKNTEVLLNYHSTEKLSVWRRRAKGGEYVHGTA